MRRLRDEDTAGVRRSLQPRGEVHRAPDNGVIHPRIAAKVAHDARTGVNAHAALQGKAKVLRPPHVLQLGQTRPHGQSHLNTGHRVLLRTAAFRIAKECDNRIAHELVDGRAMRQRDVRHL